MSKQDGPIQAEINTPTRDKRAVEQEFERRLRATVKDQRGTLRLSGQDALKQADLFGGKDSK